MNKQQQPEIIRHRCARRLRIFVFVCEIVEKNKQGKTR